MTLLSKLTRPSQKAEAQMYEVMRLFLCPRCKTFRHHRITKEQDSSIIMRCVSCESSERFVQVDGLYIQEGMDREIERYSMRRAREVLGGGGK
jgi:RNase P subunit RPR2